MPSYFFGLDGIGLLQCSNRALARSFNTLEKLLEDPEVQRFVRRVRKQRPHRKFSSDRRTQKR